MNMHEPGYWMVDNNRVQVYTGDLVPFVTRFETINSVTLFNILRYGDWIVCIEAAEESYHLMLCYQWVTYYQISWAELREFFIAITTTIPRQKLDWRQCGF